MNPKQQKHDLQIHFEYAHNIHRGKQSTCALSEMNTTDAPTHAHGSRFGFSLTPHLLEVLQQAAAQPGTPPALAQDCRQVASGPTVPWKLLQQACMCLQQLKQQQQDEEQAPTAKQPVCRHWQQTAAFCAGSRLVLPSPAARQRSKHLQQHLAALQECLDADRYSAMVADVTLQERQAAALRDDPFFPTTKLQLSFGLHVLVTMGTFFAVGYYGGRFMLHSQSWAALCGCIGLVGGLLLETTLLIVRLNAPMPLDRKYAHLLDRGWEQGQQPHQPDAVTRQPAAEQAGLPHVGSQASKQQQLRRRRAV